MVTHTQGFTPIKGTAKPTPILSRQEAEQVLADISREVRRIKRLTRKSSGRSYTRLFERIYKQNNSINLYK